MRGGGNQWHANGGRCFTEMWKPSWNRAASDGNRPRAYLSLTHIPLCFTDIPTDLNTDHVIKPTFHFNISYICYFITPNSYLTHIQIIFYSTQGCLKQQDIVLQLLKGTQRKYYNYSNQQIGSPSFVLYIESKTSQDVAFDNSPRAYACHPHMYLLD